MGEFIAKALPFVLALCVGIAFAVATRQPSQGAGFLLSVSLLLTLPYFAFLFLAGLAGGHMVIGCLLIIGLLVPGLNLLVLLWILLSTIAKIGGFARSAPFILAGCLLYLLLVKASPILLTWVTAIGAPHEGWIGPAIVGACFAGLFLGLVWLGRKYDYNPLLSAALMVGFFWYVAIFLASFLIPGDAGMMIDGGHDHTA